MKSKLIISLFLIGLVSQFTLAETIPDTMVNDNAPLLFPRAYCCTIFSQNDSQLRFMTIADHLGHTVYAAVLRINTQFEQGQSSRIELFNGRLSKGFFSFQSRVGRFSTTIQGTVGENTISGIYSQQSGEVLQRRLSCNLIPE